MALWVGLVPLCLLFGLMLAGGNWVGAGVIISALALVRLMMGGAWWVAVAWLIAVPTIGVFFDNFLEGLPFVRGKRVLFVVLLFMVTWQAVMDRRRSLAWIPLERRMLLFLAVAGVSVLVSGAEKEFSGFLRDDLSLLLDGYLMPMSAFFIARRLRWDASSFRRFATLLIGVGVFLAITAPLETLLGVDWFIPTTINAIHTLARATGTFGNAAEFGLVVSSFFLLASWFSLHTRDSFARAWVTLAMLLLLAAVVLCKTRAPWLGLLVSMAALYVLDARSRPVLNLVGFLGLFGVLAAVPYLLALEGFVQRVTDLDPIYNRIASWATALNIMLQNPITGIGMSRHAFGSVAGNYAVSVGEVSSSWIVRLAVPHNEFFNVGSMTGLFGGALYLLVVFGVVAALVRVRRRQDLPEEVRSFAVVVAAIWVGWVVNAFFSDFGSMGYVNILVYFMAGMALAIAGQPPAAARQPASPLPQPPRR